MIGHLPILVLVAVAAWLGAVWVRAKANALGLVTAPDHRSSHTEPTPRGGGIAIAVAAAAGLVWFAMQGGTAGASLWWAAGTAAALAALGFADDLRSVAVPVRFTVQAVVVAVAVFAVPPLPGVAPFSWSPTYDMVVLAIVWFAGLWWVNLFNFMDGTDGLAGFEALFVLAAAAFLATMAGEANADPVFMAAVLCVAAAAAGFLLVNRPPASIFMGDAGSLFLGTAIFVLALASARTGWLGLPEWIILTMAFWCDATLTLARRLLRRDNVMAAHRSHAYQRLARRWNSHGAVLGLLFAINLLWLLPLAMCASIWVDFAPVFVLVAAIPLGLGVVLVGAGLPDEW